MTVLPFTAQRGRVLLPLAIGLVLLVAAATAGWLYLRNGHQDRAQLLTTTVERGRIEDLVTATGTLQPRNYVDVGAQVSGQLHKIHVDVGTEVKAGDLLAEIDPTLFMAKVDASRAQLRYQRALFKDRQAQLELARIQHQRQQNLLAAGATTEESAQNAAAAYQSAQAQIEMLQAQIAQTESSLRADEANLGYARIFAPMDGTVVAISARQGQTINASQQAPVLMQIADLSSMTVQTRVSEADISRLQIGMEAYFTTLGSRDQRWYGTLYRIEPTPVVENNVVLYNALFDVDNADGSLLPQMTAQVFFVVAAADDALLVPVTAVSIPPGGRPGHSREGTVTVVDDDRQTHPRSVEIGISNRVQTQILTGLQEGEEILTTTESGTMGDGSSRPRSAMGVRMR